MSAANVDEGGRVILLRLPGCRCGTVTDRRCDFPGCGRPICLRCAVPIAIEVDFCEAHGEDDAQ